MLLKCLRFTQSSVNFPIIAAAGAAAVHCPLAVASQALCIVPTRDELSLSPGSWAVAGVIVTSELRFWSLAAVLALGLLQFFTAGEAFLLASCVPLFTEASSCANEATLFVAVSAELVLLDATNIVCCEELCSFTTDGAELGIFIWSHLGGVTPA